MSIEFQLPNIGEGVDSADIAEILIADGDTVEAEQIVMVLETDKAVVELRCPHAGTIEKLMVGEGDTIQVGQTLFTIETSDESAGPDDQQSDDSPPEETPAADVSGKGEASSAADDDASPDVEPESSGDAPATESFEFKLPNIGEGVESADIADIHVAEGDAVEAEQTIMDLETDKAVVELPCPKAGTIAKLHVSAGDTVNVGQTLMTIDGVAAAKDAKKSDGQSQKQAASPRATKGDSAAPTESATTAAKSRGDSGSNGESQRSVSVARTAELVSGDGNEQPPVPAAPSTRRLARQLGVNLRQVGGSGPGGRITSDDVQEYVKSRLTGGLPAPSSGGAMTVAAAGSLAPPPLPDFSKFGPIEREKMSKLARTAAENLTVSWNVIPHVTQHDRADVTDLEAARKKFTKGAGADGPKVTMTAIVMKALATALQQNPKFNSSLDPETQEIVFKRFYNIGCAVDTPSGLLVPVVKDVDTKSIRQVAGEIGELAALARDRKLPIDAMQGATCTVTNLGGIGGVAFTPIVNYPEVCILGLARGQKELRLEDGELTERLMLPLSLSYDHRVINGADAARFLVSLCEMLSDPFQLLSAI